MSLVFLSNKKKIIVLIRNKFVVLLVHEKEYGGIELLYHTLFTLIILHPH